MRVAGHLLGQSLLGWQDFYRLGLGDGLFFFFKKKNLAGAKLLDGIEGGLLFISFQTL